MEVLELDLPGVVALRERVARLFLMHANKRERVDMVGPGAIVGVVGLKASSTGETLCQQENPVIL